MDLEQIRAENMIEKPRCKCREHKESRGHTAGQWKRDDESRVCKECVGGHEQSGHPWQCHICKCWQPTTAFYGKVCLNCKETKRCRKEEADFSASAWRIRHQCRRTCKTGGDTASRTGNRCATCVWQRQT